MAGSARYVKRSLLWAFLIGSISWQTGPKALYQREEKRLKAWFLFLEVIAASTGRSAASKKVQEEYCKMVDELGTEFDILRTIPIEEIRSHSGHLISEGICRLREGRVKTSSGL